MNELICSFLKEISKIKDTKDINGDESKYLLFLTNAKLADRNEQTLNIEAVKEDDDNNFHVKDFWKTFRIGVEQDGPLSLINQWDKIAGLEENVVAALQAVMAEHKNLDVDLIRIECINSYYFENRDSKNKIMFKNNQRVLETLGHKERSDA